MPKNPKKSALCSAELKLDTTLLLLFLLHMFLICGRSWLCLIRQTIRRQNPSFIMVVIIQQSAQKNLYVCCLPAIV